jgi:copper chaperone CopZ
MKSLIAGCLLAAGLATAAFAGEKTETIKVSGWHCGGCAARTESALKDVKGVQSVSSDKAKKEVVVKYDDAKVKRADLEKAIADSGFEVAKD